MVSIHLITLACGRRSPKWGPRFSHPSKGLRFSHPYKGLRFSHLNKGLRFSHLYKGLRFSHLYKGENPRVWTYQVEPDLSKQFETETGGTHGWMIANQSVFQWHCMYLTHLPCDTPRAHHYVLLFWHYATWHTRWDEHMEKPGHKQAYQLPGNTRPKSVKDPSGFLMRKLHSGRAFSGLRAVL